jgi:hypothetical protein
LRFDGRAVLVKVVDEIHAAGGTAFASYEDVTFEEACLALVVRASPSSVGWTSS